MESSFLATRAGRFAVFRAQVVLWQGYGRVHR